VLRKRSRAEFEADANLRDLAERNLEVAAQCCIDICHRIIALEGAQKPRDYYESIIRMGEIGLLSPEFARQLAPVAGLRNVLTHEYLDLKWDRIYKGLQEDVDNLARFGELVRQWIAKKEQE
jgi:uncharacterized protein YutE (UPF0331/DUF86 family)